MKIVVISPFYHPSMGGVETIVKQTAEELARRKYAVSVITTTCSNSWTELSEPGVKVENGVTVYRLKPQLTKIGYATLMDGLKTIIKREKPDIVHSHNLHPHLFQALSFKNDGHFKLVAQLHYPAATGIDHIGAKLAYPVVTTLLQRQQQKVDAFIVHTNLEKIWLISKGFDEQKIHKLSYPCASSMLFEKCAKDAGKGGSMAGMAEEPDLLYVGRITRRKGLHVLLQALPSVISDVKGLTAVIAGPTDKTYYKTLAALARELNLGNHVIFSQALPEEVKYRIMCKCKLFVVPSIRDYTPVTLIEAQALGKPVISTITGAIPEIVKNGETGLLVEPQNPIALAEAIKCLLLNEEKKEFMGKNALQWVRLNFLLDDVVDKLEKLYHDCMAN